MTTISQSDTVIIPESISKITNNATCQFSVCPRKAGGQPVYFLNKQVIGLIKYCISLKYKSVR